jgi:two-component system, NtrC family, response regulator AtoC
MLPGFEDLMPEIQQTLIGVSPVIQRVRDLIRRIALSDGNVLITGETGTGKEVVAHLVHQQSNRHKERFIALNCAAIPESLFESELFGHERGAFTGANQTRRGHFELASGGVLLLDDMDDMPIRVQVKLLRALQEGEITRVGGEQPIKVDVRVISTTKQLLRGLIDKGVFREDLYFRLNVLPIHIPPLRERVEDILPLAYHFLSSFKRNSDLDFETEIQRLFCEYHWPGNVRELEHLVERMASLATGNKIDGGSLPGFLRQQLLQDKRSRPIFGGMNLQEEINKVEKRILEWALSAAEGNQSRAAGLLQLNRTTLRSKLLKFKIIKQVSDE